MIPVATRMAVARWSLLIIMVAMGAALVVSAWSNRKNAEQVSELLDRGQAEGLARLVMELNRTQGRPATSEELAELVTENRDAGLRYVALLGDDGSAAAEAGEPIGARGRGDVESHALQRLGSRVRVLFGPPLFGSRGDRSWSFGQPPPPPPPDGLPLMGAHAHGFGRRHFRLMPGIVLEFEPTISGELRAQAARSFAWSSAGAVALAGVAVALWLLLLREQKQRERLERDRTLTALGEMSAVLAHEIRNPLASLKGHAQLLAEELERGTPHFRKVERIVDEAKRLEELSGTLLDLVRSSKVERTATDPRALLGDAAAAINGDRVHIDTDKAPESWPLDALKIGQVLRNLLQNALQASPDGEPVEARVTTERGFLVFAVRDHGPGLPVSESERLFEAFHTTRTKGTGLGLAIARRIVELHGGRIEAFNHPAGGAEFSVRLPS